MNLLEQRAYRCLRHMKPYHDLTVSGAVPPGWISDVGLTEDEDLVGVYIPVPGEPTESIVVGSRGLHIERNGPWIFIGYDQLDDISLPREFWGEGKLRMTWFSVGLTGGKTIVIPIRTHHWKFSDIPEFMRFLIDVRGDVRDGKIKVD